MYDTPGVYIEEISNQPLTIESGPSAVPVFVGSFNPIADKVPTGQCVPIATWLDFTTKYTAGQITATFAALGAATASRARKAKAKSRLIEADTVVVESIAFDHGYYDVHMYFMNGGGPCYILNIGEFPDLAPIAEEISKYPDISLLVCSDADDDRREEVYTALEPLLASDGGYFLIADSVDGTGSTSATTKMQTAVYYPAIETTLKLLLPAEADILLKGLSDDTTLADLKVSDPAQYADVSAAIGLAAAEDGIVTLPPSSTIAGAYCSTDRSRGVWKAPANIALKGVIGLTKRITNAEQAPMNAEGINAIRLFEGRGFLVWGARTRDVLSDEWRYVPVRRLFNSVERDCRKSIEKMIFEPNSQPTWERVRGSLEIYLNGIWRQGGLKGNRPDEAYSVTVGLGTTMTAADVDAGVMVVRIALAAVRPGEFIVLEFSQIMSAAS